MGVGFQREVPTDMFWRLSIALLLAIASVPFQAAQMRGATGGRGSVGHSGYAHRVAGIHHGAHARRIPLSSPFLDSDYGYLGYDPTEPPRESYVEQDAPPQVVIVQPASADESPRKTKPAPLLIEWRGDRYVRFGGADAYAEPGTSAHPDYAQPTSTSRPAKTPTSAAQKGSAESQAGELPAVLVFHDGHSEQLADYTIADGVIYIRGNDWQNGYWTKRIPLAALDSPATIRANQQRGVKFMLPSAPNVVIASF
jgi:hypothetical protein